VSFSPPAVDPSSRRTWPQLAASCAFLAGGIDILSFVLYHYFVYRYSAHPEWKFFAIGMVIGVAIVVIGVAAAAVALWTVGRRQRAVAPLSAHLGQWSVATYVVAFVLLFILRAQPQLWHARRIGNWVFQLTMIPFTLACGCLGLASRRGADPRRRWASRSLLAMATFEVFSLTWRLAGLPTGQGWPGLLSIDLAVHVAMWALVGAWLLSTTRAGG
jgi:hypothetical protein